MCLIEWGFCVQERILLAYGDSPFPASPGGTTAIPRVTPVVWLWTVTTYVAARSLSQEATCFDGPNVDFTVALAFTGLAEGLTDLTITSNGMAGHSVEIAPCNPGACKFNPVSLNPNPGERLGQD